MPLYLAEMTALQSTDPDIHQEFIDGNFVVNKNQIPFCAIGVDHALEHINRIIKVTGELVGITHNVSAQERFFLTAPELSRFAEGAHVMAGSPTTTCKKHHDLSLAGAQERFFLTAPELSRFAEGAHVMAGSPKTTCKKHHDLSLAGAQERFFLTAPELSRLAEGAHVMAGSPTTTCKKHHDLSLAVWTRQEENIARLKTVLMSSMNPTKYEGEDLPNIITMVVMPAKVKPRRHWAAEVCKLR